MYQINDEFICKWTAGCGCSIALLCNADGQKPAEAMASHAWSEDAEELFDSLARYKCQHGLSDNFVIWLCTLSIYQPKKNDSINDIGPTVDQQIKLEPAPFTQVVQSPEVVNGHGLVAIHTHTAGVASANLYTRLWCPFEMHKAIGSRLRICAAASEKYIEELEKTFKYMLEQVATLPLLAILHVLAGHATCTCWPSYMYLPATLQAILHVLVGHATRTCWPS